MDESRILFHLFLPRGKHELVQAAKHAEPSEEISSCKTQTLLITVELLVLFFLAEKEKKQC